VIGYTMVGVRDLDRAAAFYGPIFREIGFEECFRDGQAVAWGDPSGDRAPRLFARRPFDGAPAGAGNGAMTAFLVDDPGRIDRCYEQAMRGGGSDEGPPGQRPRYGPGFYAAHARDPDGNKIAFARYDARAGRSA
jgi:catechol 2,3-dioxygenase-like lactoylglutathione lyase family enzyme